MSRLSNATSIFSTIVGIAALIVAFLSWAQLWNNGLYTLTGTLPNIEAISSFRTTRRSGSINQVPKENMRFNFDLDVDLTPLFTWNTKQVFVYLTVDYPGSREDVFNTVTFWDRIVKTPEKAKISLKDSRSKYQVYDPSSFRGENATVTLRYDVQPHVGFLLHGKSPIGWVKFPESKPPPKHRKS